jgi:hypothetical protein
MIDSPTRKPISDEMLMRLADGDLGGEERSFVAAEVARDPDLAKRFEAFRFTKEELPAIFAATLEAPKLIERVLGGNAGRPSVNDATRFMTTSVCKRVSVRRQFLALAAASALLLAGAAGWLLRDGARPDYAGVVAPPSLQRALEETPSRQLATLGSGSSVRVNATFVSLRGRWCREYEVLNADRAQSSAVACRGTDGAWRVEVEEAVSDALSADPKAYQPAGEKPARRGDKAGTVAEYRDRIMEADVSLEEELALTKGHWRR